MRAVLLFSIIFAVLLAEVSPQLHAAECGDQLSSNTPSIIVDPSLDSTSAMASGSPWEWTTARAEVLALLKTRARALGLPGSKRDRLFASVDLAEHRQYFNPILSPLLLATNEPTYKLVADRLWDHFTEAQLHQDRPRSLGARAYDAMHFGRLKLFTFGKGLVVGTGLSLIMTFAAYLHSPWSDNAGPALKSYVFRVTPHYLLPHPAPTERRHGQTEYSPVYLDIWQRVNRYVPMNEREGRSIFYEVQSLHFMIISAYQDLHSHRPALGSADEQVWRQSMLSVLQATRDMPRIFRDVYEVPSLRRLFEPSEQLIMRSIEAELAGTL